MRDVPTVPKVSIGMPVFNGEKFLSPVLDSLIGQSFLDFELIISDNASTDGTEQICREYAARDHRINYIRQPVNAGIVANFKFVQKKSRGEYFMWAASDDIRSLDFVELNVKFLSENPDYVASTSPDGYESEDLNLRKLSGFALDGELFQRFVQFFDHCWESHGIVYSLMRTNVIQACDVLNQKGYLGADWGIGLYLASKGKVHRVKDGYTIFGVHGLSRDADFVKSVRSSAIEVIIPFYRLGKYIFSLNIGFNRKEKFKILVILVKLNVKFVFSQVWMRLYPAYCKYIRPIVHRKQKVK